MKSGDCGSAATRQKRVETALSSINEVVRGLCRELVAEPGPSPPETPTPGATTDDVLSNLYVASLHLHGSLDVEDVLTNLCEILINFMGVARFRVLLVDRAAGRLCSIADETQVRPVATPVALDDGILGVVARTGIPYFETGEPLNDEAPMCACVPLKMGADVLGVIAVERFLAHKVSFSLRDYQLLDLISERAAPALLAAALHQWFKRRTEGTEDSVWGVLSAALAPGHNVSSREMEA